MTEQEKIEIFANYLPYGVNLAVDTIYEGFTTKLVIINDTNSFRNGLKLNQIYEFDAKLILHPLSDLTKPIKVDGYNDGKEFVPMYELCVKYACRIPENPEYGTYLLGEKNKVNYKWFFSFDNDNICFELRDNNKEFTVHSLPQYELIQQLYKWHFDIHGLIGQGLAIDINTLKNNTL